jgi:hypothetical protein
LPFTARRREQIFVNADEVGFLEKNTNIIKCRLNAEILLQVYKEIGAGVNVIR